MATIAFCAYTGRVELRTAVCGKDIENFDRGGVTMATVASPPKSISARLSTGLPPVVRVMEA